MRDYKHLGFLSSAPDGLSIELQCDDCRVTWTGCAAAAECPECGSHKDWDRMMEQQRALDAAPFEPEP